MSSGAQRRSEILEARVCRTVAHCRTKAGPVGRKVKKVEHFRPKVTAIAACSSAAPRGGTTPASTHTDAILEHLAARAGRRRAARRSGPQGASGTSGQYEVTVLRDAQRRSEVLEVGVATSQVAKFDLFARKHGQPKRPKGFNHAHEHSLKSSVAMCGKRAQGARACVYG